MSLSLALSSALSGISLAARSTQIVANNIANAQSDAYGVRRLAQSSRVLGSLGNGVTADGTIRHTNPGLIAEVRQATSQSQQLATLRAFWSNFEAGFGIPGESGSLSDRLSGLETALQLAAASPDEPAVLHRVGQAAADITQKLRDLSLLIQAERDAADAALATDLSTLNDSLSSVARLNQSIQHQTLLGGDPSGLMDTRQALVDKIATLIPVREFPREDGRIMLMSSDGTILVDRAAAQFGFNRTPTPTPHNRVEDGRLSPVILDGRTITLSSAMFSSGQIGSNLRIRDQIAPDAQQALDRLASDLIRRFATQDVDPSLAPGDEGLFTSGGLAGFPMNITGLAGQIRLDERVDPQGSREFWRLRDGLNALSPGAPADNSILAEMKRTLAHATQLADTGSPARSAFGHASDHLASITEQRLHLDNANSQASAKLTILTETLASEGVDTDRELSQLLVLEQAYSANARVLATIDSMLRTILEI